MNDLWPVVDVRNLTKDFRIYRSTGDIVRELLQRKRQHQIFRALEDVSFSVARGEVLGIMGPNGAGKSTLLKMITGTLEPTSGTVELRGRVSAILELGTGFSPHKTGRENVEMGCLVLGMHPSEIRRKAEQIIEFSELEAFIDRPFHTYSSG
ncbi:MAG: ABC transporter ATP-binding protein, partial [Planctomycetaceae bacterium]